LTKDAAFLSDRDGVLDFERSDYVKSIAELKFIPGAFKQVSELAKEFPFLIIITNQSVVGRGLTTEDTLKRINQVLVDKFLEETGRKIDGIYYCPHKPEDNCKCRKPRTELFERAAKDFNLDLSKSVFIGDKSTDEEAARRAGCGFIRVKTNTSEIIEEVHASA
jgi:histidinol-phosphate phosphatase family protein